MTHCNSELIQLMHNLSLTPEEVAKCLGVSVNIVYGWTNTEGGEQRLPMPEAELRLLKYSLMSENKQTTLF